VTPTQFKVVHLHLLAIQTLLLVLALQRPSSDNHTIMLINDRLYQGFLFVVLLMLAGVIWFGIKEIRERS